MKYTYYTPRGGLHPQSERLYAPAVVTTAYTVIPAVVMSDIVTSYLPLWSKTRVWIIARPIFTEVVTEPGNSRLSMGRRGLRAM